MTTARLRFCRLWGLCCVVCVGLCRYVVCFCGLCGFLFLLLRVCVCVSTGVCCVLCAVCYVLCVCCCCCCCCVLCAINCCVLCRFAVCVVRGYWVCMCMLLLLLCVVLCCVVLCAINCAACCVLVLCAVLFAVYYFCDTAAIKHCLMLSRLPSAHFVLNRTYS
jgi:hypothetical protein